MVQMSGTQKKTDVEILLPYIKHLKDKTFWCPFDKEWSEYVKVLKENGYKVVHSHIDEGKDFFNYEPKEWDVILSNPPFKNKREFIKRCLSFNKPFCLFLPSFLINDKILNDTFEGSQLQMLIPYNRASFINGVKGDSKNTRPPFKTVYFAKNFFKENLILLNENKLFKIP